MSTKFEWIDFQDGAVGMLPCALMTIVVTKDPVGKYVVRFGAKQVSGFATLEEAKTEGLKLLRNTLTECIINLNFL